MSLLASVCGVKVIIPPAPSAAVVAGSAMLGRYAHDVTKERNGRPIETQAQQEESANKSKEALWEIMVCIALGSKTSSHPILLPVRHDACGKGCDAFRCGLRTTFARCKVQDFPRVHRRTTEMESDDGRCRKMKVEVTKAVICDAVFEARLDLVVMALGLCVSY